jgi:hypothetical protein
VIRFSAAGPDAPQNVVGVEWHYRAFGWCPSSCAHFFLACLVR